MTTATFAIRGDLLLGSHLTPGAIVIADGVVSSIERGDVHDGNLPEHIVDAAMVSPGMIDLQVNGAIGLEVGTDPRDIEAISTWMPSTGVTSWLPTIVTSAAAYYPQVFAAWRDLDPSIGATPLGLHLEGPFLSPQRKGAHQLRYIEEATDDLFASWLDHDSVKLVTLAPEREGGHTRIRSLVDRGILTSLGHTDATYEQFVAGVDQGARMATHLFNAMSPMHHRQPGAMIATMTDERITCGLIPDGVHSHPATLRLAINAMGIDRIAIVSDMMSACGFGPGIYGIGGQEVTVDEISARLKDGTLAGSILTMDQAIRNLVAWSDTTFGEALYMATAVPAGLLRDTERGTLRVGARADITAWTADLGVQETWVGGSSVYAAKPATTGR